MFEDKNQKDDFDFFHVNPNSKKQKVHVPQTSNQ